MDELKPLEFKKLDTKDFLNPEIPILNTTSFVDNPLLEKSKCFKHIIRSKDKNGKPTFDENDIKIFCNYINQAYNDKMIKSLVCCPYYMELAQVSIDQRIVLMVFCETKYSYEELKKYNKKIAFQLKYPEMIFNFN